LVSLAISVSILALAVMLGGLAAAFRHRGERAMPAIRTFAVVAAASIALLHLLPEAIGEIGWRALLAAAAGCLTPAVLERAVPMRRGHSHRAPTAALAMGYAAVLAHQLGEGAAVASLDRLGQLTMPVVLAIAAHTVPLAMVVAIQVLEAKGGVGGKRATSVALAGVALATVVGAFAASLIGVTQLEVVEPWLIATVAGILLHALSHEALESTAATPASRAGEAVAGLLGLALAVIGVEEEAWLQRFPLALRIAGIGLLSALVLLRSLASGRTAAHRH
jgi:hypothetical protein